MLWTLPPIKELNLMLSLADIVHAQMRLHPFLPPTPLETAPDLGENIWLKLENTNRTHSFKIRGALNAILSLDDEARNRGIIAASSGNHAQGLAYAAALVGARATILMPRHTPNKKVKGVQRYGAEAILFGDNYDAAEAEARRLERESGMVFVSAYNDLKVAAGAGTIGLEIVQALPDVARVLVCVSGGGLISGVATAVKALRPEAEVIGINAESAPAMYNTFYDTDLPEVWETLAEALSGDIEAGSITIPIAKAHVDRMLLVSEAEIAAAMRWMIAVQGWLVEGGGAVGVAAALHAKIPLDGRPTAIVVSGGNVDAHVIQRVLAGDGDTA